MFFRIHISKKEFFTEYINNVDIFLGYREFYSFRLVNHIDFAICYAVIAREVSLYTFDSITRIID